MRVIALALSPQFLKPVTIMGLRGTSLVVKFGLTLFIAKFLGLEILGLYGLISAACIMAPSILGLALMYSQSRKAVTQTLEEITLALKSYFSFTTLLYSVVLLLAIAYGHITGQFYLCFLVAALVFLEHVNQELYGLLLNLSKPLLGNFLHFVRSAAWTLVYMPIAYLNPDYRDISILLEFWIIGSIICLAIFFFTIRHWPWNEVTRDKKLLYWVKDEFRSSRTIYGNGIATTLGTYANHFLVTFFLGLELTGVYVFFSQATSAMTNLLLTGVIQIARPKMVHSFKVGNISDFNKIFRNCLINTAVIALLMMVGSAIFMYIIVHYIVDRPLAVEWLPVFLAMLVVFFQTNIKEVGSMFFYSQHRDDLIFRYSLIGISLTILISPVGLYFFSLWGAPLSSILSGLIVLLIYKSKISQILAKQHGTP